VVAYDPVEQRTGCFAWTEALRNQGHGSPCASAWRMLRRFIHAAVRCGETIIKTANEPLDFWVTRRMQRLATKPINTHASRFVLAQS
jgi:hypothetical protein